MSLLTRPIVWDDLDQQLALGEGWDIFECFGNEDGSPYQIQYLVEPYLLDYLDYEEPKFDDDSEVWVHIWQKAKEGSLLHHKALEFIYENSPAEYRHIVKWLAEEGLL